MKPDMVFTIEEVPEGVLLIPVDALTPKRPERSLAVPRTPAN
jgi:hypothetical protein